MESNKKVILISESEELYKAFNRALKFLAGIDLLKFSGRFYKNDAVIYDMKNNEIDFWIWGKFRTKALSPLIVIGTDDEASFINKNPVFSTYSDEHAYFQIPFDLRELIATMKRLKLIHDHITRRLIVSDFSKGYENKLITHDLKVVKDDKQATIDNISKAKDFYDAKGDTKIVKFINNKIKEMQASQQWEHIAFEIKQYLEEKLKTRGSQ